MNEVILRFNFPHNGRELEVLLDERLSFAENFELLKEIELGIDGYLVYDPAGKVFIDMRIPLCEMGVYDHLFLYLFKG